MLSYRVNSDIYSTLPSLTYHLLFWDHINPDDVVPKANGKGVDIYVQVWKPCLASAYSAPI